MDKSVSPLLPSGYIRNLKINVFPPQDIINLIYYMLCTEYIHLIEYDGNKAHWRIPLNDILNPFLSNNST